MVRLEEISVNDIIGVSEDEKTYGVGTQSQVLRFVRQYPEGVTAQMVAEFMKISQNRAREVLKELVLKREIYHRKISGKINLYYPNGELVHKYLQEARDFGTQIFRLSFHEGRKNPRLQIQERKYTLLEGEKVEGSIFIDIENINAFNDFLTELLIKFNKYDKECKI